MQHVYARASTASQSLLRQRHILTEAGLLVRAEDVAGGFRPAGGVKLYEDPATTSKIPALNRPAFGKVAGAAHPGAPFCRIPVPPPLNLSAWRSGRRAS